MYENRNAKMFSAYRKPMDSAQRNYGVTDKELIVVVKSMVYLNITY